MNVASQSAARGSAVLKTLIYEDVCRGVEHSLFGNGTGRKAIVAQIPGIRLRAHISGIMATPCISTMNDNGAQLVW